MSEKHSTWSGLWHELQRRHVVRVALGYAAVAFVVLQMGEIILPAFTENAVFMQALVVLAALLFPLVVALAWVYEVTPGGIRRMAEVDAEAGHQMELAPVFPRIAFLVLTIVMVGASGFWLFTTGLERGTLGPGSVRLPVQQVDAEYDPNVPLSSLAVLPLEDFSPDASDDFFAAGMHEAIVSKLGQLPALRVVPRSSVRQYAGTNTPNNVVGAELGVDAVVTGSVTRSGDQVRVTVTLSHAASETTLWSNSYEGDIADLFEIQRQIAEAIATEIQGELLPEEQTLMAYREGPEDVELNMGLMRGRDLASSGAPDDLRAAEEYFERASEEMGPQAPFLAERARVQLELGFQEAEGDQQALNRVIPGVRMLLDSAFAIDADSDEAQAVYHFLEVAEGMVGMGTDDFHTGPAIAAPPAPEVPEVEAAEPVDRASSVTVISTGDGEVVVDTERIQRIVGEMFTNGAEWGRRLESRLGAWVIRQQNVDMRRPSADAVVHLAESMAQRGEYENALQLLRTERQAQPEATSLWDAEERILASREQYAAIVALRHERAGALSEDEDDVEDLEGDLEDDGPRGYWKWRYDDLSDRMDDGLAVSQVDMALAALKVGEKDDALEHLQAAAEAGDPRLMRERNNPAFDKLRSEPRFRRLMAQLARRSDRRSGEPGREFRFPR